MTARAAAAPPASLGEAIRAIPRGPAEGWISLVAVVVMVDVLALSLVNSSWTGNVGNSSFLPWLAVAGTLFGVLGAKVGWGRWRTYLVGALLGGLLIPLIVGGVLRAVEPGWDPGGLVLRMYRSFEVVRHVYMDFVVFNRSQTSEFGYYHLLFGAMVWGAGLLAGFAVFARRRPLDVVVTLGLLLMVNIFITDHDQLFLLEIYAAAALMLLIRTHVFEEEVTWLRRKIGDPASVSQLYLNGGATFVAIALIAAIALTWAATSAPLKGFFADIPAHLQALSQIIQRFAPPGGDPIGIGGVTFGDSVTTSGIWNPNGRTAFRVTLPPTEKEQFKWRAGTFSVYTTYGWSWGSTRSQLTEARATVLGGATAGDAPVADGRREVSFRVTPDSFLPRTILSPNTIQSVDRPTQAITLGADGWFTSVEAAESTNVYTVTALVRITKGDGAVTEPQLRLASTDYPEEIRELYTALPTDAMGPAAKAMLARIIAQVDAPGYADPANPYDVAFTMQEYLRNPANITYQSDVRNERNAQCGGVSTVECFAIIRKGYCDYYASAMTVFLRSLGIPARVAYGFLPGERSPSSGIEVVSSSRAHYWVEVYFTGYGWIEFDPTGGGVGEPAPIPTGVAPAPTPTPTAGPTLAPGASRTPAPTRGPIISNGGGGGSIAPFIVIGIILLVGVAMLVYVAARRAPRKPMHPDQAWGSLGRLAARIGLGPRPSQTVYEYAGALGDAVPDARLELTTIARAKVEVAYGKRDLGGDRLQRIAEAYQRLRFALLGVILRRGLRPRRPGRRR